MTPNLLVTNVVSWDSIRSTFFAAKIALSANHSWFVYCQCTLENIWWWSMKASCKSMIVQKSLVNFMHSVSSVVTFPSPISNNCFENLPHAVFFELQESKSFALYHYIHIDHELFTKITSSCRITLSWSHLIINQFA
jgi:hypothetical protein